MRTDRTNGCSIGGAVASQNLEATVSWWESELIDRVHCE